MSVYVDVHFNTIFFWHNVAVCQGPDMQCLPTSVHPSVRPLYHVCPMVIFRKLSKIDPWNTVRHYWLCCHIQIVPRRPSGRYSGFRYKIRPPPQLLLTKHDRRHCQLSAVVKVAWRWEHVVYNRRPSCWRSWSQRTGGGPYSFHSVIFLFFIANVVLWLTNYGQ